MTISMDKKYQTRDGREVLVLCVDSPVKGYPIVAAIHANAPHWGVGVFSSGGLVDVGSVSPDDLVEVRKTITGFVNIYGGSLASCVHKTRAGADLASIDNRIACIPVTFYEGEGL